MNKRKIESTEDDQMKRLVICKLCHETLEEPIILPCGKTICSKHLPNETSNFKCGLCDNSHDKTVDKFPINEMANGLIQICDDYVNLNSIDLSPSYKLAKEKIKQLNDLIKESELLTRDPAFYINNCFTKLRNEIDLSKEKLRKDIEQKYEQIVNELKEIETKCKQNAQNIDSNIRLEQTIESAKERLNKLTEKLEFNLNRDNCCEELSRHSRVSISELKYEMNKCQVALLDNKEYKFNSISTKDLIFGDLVTNDVEIIDESRSEGTMRFVIKDFSKFRHTFIKSYFIEQLFLVKNIPWLFGCEMKQIENDIYLEIMSKPTGLTLLSNPIKTKIKIEMMKTSGESYCQKIFNEKISYINRNVFFGKFILLKDIMNPINNLYNIQTDSVTFEAQIKISD